MLHNSLFPALVISHGGRAHAEERGVRCDAGVGKKRRCSPHTLVPSPTPCREQKCCPFGDREWRAFPHQGTARREGRRTMVLFLPLSVLGFGRSPGEHEVDTPAFSTEAPGTAEPWPREKLLSGVFRAVVIEQEEAWASGAV